MGTASMRHPVTGAIYTDEAGDVRVEWKGQVGFFRSNGSWIRGELRIADPMMCRWIAGHSYNEVPFRDRRLQLDSGAGSKKPPAKEGQ